jgi:hypothetical protein
MAGLAGSGRGLRRDIISGAVCNTAVRICLHPDPHTDTDSLKVALIVCRAGRANPSATPPMPPQLLPLHELLAAAILPLDKKETTATSSHIVMKEWMIELAKPFSIWLLWNAPAKRIAQVPKSPSDFTDRKWSPRKHISPALRTPPPPPIPKIHLRIQQKP